MRDRAAFADTARRLVVVGLVVIVLFTVLIGRAAVMGTLEADGLRKQGERALRGINPIPATRGRILARDGRVLVDNLAVNVVKLDSSKVPKAVRTAVLTRLAAALDVAFSTIEARLVDPRNPRFEPATIARNVKESTIVYLNEHPELFPGVTTGVTWQRIYPQGNIAPHILGYLGPVNPDDIKRQPADLHYQPSDLIGRAGIEKSFERELRGVPGEEVVTKDPLGRVISGESQLVRDPVPGKDVRLAIDIDLQRLGEETLAQGVRAARRNVEADHPDRYLKANAGALVVFNTETGEVLTSASYPTYDPSEFAEGLTAKRNAELMDPNQHAPLINRVIEGKYPPGSTFKLFTSIAALQGGLITPTSTYEDKGAFEVEEFKARNIKWRWKNAGNPPSVFGTINLRDALRVSSDAFYYRLGYAFHGLGRASESGIQDVAREMGLGKFTNIHLPNESRGVIPDRARQVRLARQFPKKFRAEWPTGATINVSIGQGDVLVTPLQLARSYAALANGGTVLDAKIEIEVIDRAVADQNAKRRSAPTTTKPPAPPSTSSTVPPTPSTIAGASGAVALAAQAAQSTRVDTSSASSEVAAATDPLGAFGIAVAPTTTLPPVKVRPQVEGHIDIADDQRAALLGGLRDVVAVQGPRGGTAAGAFEGFPLDRFPVAGKTGTAQKKPQQDYSLFVAFGPLPSPKYAVAVVIEQGGFGRQAAALSRRMFEGLAGVPTTPVRTVSSVGGAEQ